MTKHLVSLLQQPKVPIHNIQADWAKLVEDESKKRFKDDGEEGKQMNVEVIQKSWTIRNYCFNRRAA